MSVKSGATIEQCLPTYLLLTYLAPSHVSSLTKSKLRRWSSYLCLASLGNWAQSNPKWKPQDRTGEAHNLQTLHIWRLFDLMVRRCSWIDVLNGKGIEAHPTSKLKSQHEYLNPSWNWPQALQQQCFAWNSVLAVDFPSSSSGWLWRIELFFRGRLAQPSWRKNSQPLKQQK